MFSKYRCTVTQIRSYLVLPRFWKFGLQLLENDDKWGSTFRVLLAQTLPCRYSSFAKECVIQIKNYVQYS